MAGPTPIRRFGLILRLVIGTFGFFGFLGLALIIPPLWPITIPIFGIMAILSPFVAIFSSMGQGPCPYCGGKVSVVKKTGGTVCKSCKGRIAINSGQLIPLDAPAVVMPTPGQAGGSPIPFATARAGGASSTKAIIGLGGCGGCLFVVLAFILFGVFLAHQEANRRAALTPEQREVEDKQKAEEARIAAAQQAAADKKRAEEAKMAAAHQAEVDKQKAAEEKAAQSAPSPAKVEETTQPKEDAPAKEVNRLTVENFSRIQDGMTYNQVKRIIGPASEETASSNIGAGTEFAVKTVMVTWKGSWGANCNVTFQNGEVMAKAQFGLPHGDPTPDLPDEEAGMRLAAKAERRIEQQQAEARRWVEQQAAEAKRKAESERKVAIEAARWHTWTDASGEHKIEARFGGVVAGNVKLTKRDGTVLTLPLEKLSDEDQEWIKNRSK